jgi:hypothetical protein
MPLGEFQEDLHLGEGLPLSFVCHPADFTGPVPQVYYDLSGRPAIL